MVKEIIVDGVAYVQKEDDKVEKKYWDYKLKKVKDLRYVDLKKKLLELDDRYQGTLLENKEGELYFSFCLQFCSDELKKIKGE